MATARVMARKPGLVRSGVFAGIAGVVALTGALVSVPVAQAADPMLSVPLSPLLPLPLAQSGELTMLGPNGPDFDYERTLIPASLDGVAVSQVVEGGASTLALTAAGKVVGWGSGFAKTQNVPVAVSNSDVVQIALGATSNYAGAVTSDGHLLTWGVTSKNPTPLNVPVGLTGVKQLAIVGDNAVALKSDGSVAAWGSPGQVGQPMYNDLQFINDVPAELAPGGSMKAVALAAAGTQRVLALTDQGTVIEWGVQCASCNDPTKVPAAVQVPGNVKAIAGWSSGGLALLADDSLLAWSNASGTAVGPVPQWSSTDPDTKFFPESVLAATPASISGGADIVGVVDDAGVLHEWGATSSSASTYPDEMIVHEDLPDGPIAQFGVAPSASQTDGGAAVGGVIVTKMLRAAAPLISGTAKVASTLTGTPGTFSASPDSLTGQWLTDGSPIDGATGTTLSLTAAMVGHQISYRSTATKTGETMISSTSAAVTVANPVPATVKVTATKGTYGSAATVAVTVTGAAGNVSLTVDGKSVGTKTLAGGKASFSVVRTATPGNHALKATYPGGEAFGAGSGTGTLSVAKGRVGVPALKVAKASHKKAGTVAVTVASPVGLVKAAGTAQLVLTKGKSTKKVNLKVVNGKAAGKVPKLPKGTWTASVTYLGSGYYVAAKSKTVKVKSK